MKVGQLTQEFLNDLFLILRKVHDSHWKAPMLAAVKGHLDGDGVYEFKAGTVEKRMWTCRLTITGEAGELAVESHLNHDLPVAMRAAQAKMKKEFDRQLVAYLAKR